MHAPCTGVCGSVGSGSWEHEDRRPINPSPWSRRHFGYVISGAVPAGRLQPREILSVPDFIRRDHARLTAVQHHARSQTPLDDAQWDGTSRHITSTGHE